MAVGDFERIAERRLELNESITRCYDDVVSLFRFSLISHRIERFIILKFYGNFTLH